MGRGGGIVGCCCCCGEKRKKEKKGVEKYTNKKALRKTHIYNIYKKNSICFKNYHSYFFSGHIY